MGNERLIQALNETYDRVMFDSYEQEVLGEDDFTNFGLWLESTKDVREAHENIMGEIVDRMSGEGAILDVACGKGASTAFLSRRFSGRPISGVNISQKQIAVCRSKVPSASFYVMDAVSLGLQSASFSDVVCVEAAFHFNTRSKFLMEAYRVLQPGGRLVLADILISDGGAPEEAKEESIEWIPASNSEFASAQEYRAILHDLGYRDVDIQDVTLECTDRFVDHCERFARDKRECGEIEHSFFEERMASLSWLRAVSRPYLLLAATK